MRDDYVNGLVQQVKEEVIENYLMNRRLIEEQRKEFDERARRVNRLKELVGKRFLRIFGLLIAPEYIKQFIELIGLEHIRPFEFFGRDLNMHKLHLINASGFTLRSRHRRLILDSYERLKAWTDKYNEAYEDLAAECRAVNINIDWFKKEFDLLGIIQFLKNLDIMEVERKHFLGGNFTAKELMSIEDKMIVRQLNWETLHLPAPIRPHELAKIRKPLEALANHVYNEYQIKLRARIL